MVADEMTTQSVRVSAAPKLTQFCRNMSASTQKGGQYQYYLPHYKENGNLYKWDHWEIRLKYVIIGIYTNIEVIVVSLTTWEVHHSPRAVVSFPGR